MFDLPHSFRRSLYGTKSLVLISIVGVLSLSSIPLRGIELIDYLPYTPGQSSNLSAESGFGLEVAGTVPGQFQWTISGLGMEGLREKYLLGPSGLSLEEEFGISPDGLSEIYEEVHDPVWNLLPATVEIDQVVNSASAYNGSELGVSWSGTVTGTVTIGQMESVETPAGTFNALKVKIASAWSETGTTYTSEGTTTQTWWLAEMRGVVRLDYAYTEKYTEDGETENDSGDVSFLLDSSTLLELPMISTQPINTTVTTGLPAELSVVATGPGTLEYAWFKEGNNPVGENLPTLSIAEAAATDAGSYVVHITNHNGTTISETVSLTVEAAEVIEIPDTFLKREILRANGKFEGDVTRADLENLEVLEASRLTNLKDLTGLEYAINLTDLRLSRNAITDLTPLAGLTQMQHLSLGNNMITTIDPLADLVNLVTLDVSSNQITDLAPVANMLELHTLAASVNQIDSIEPLRGLTKLVTVFISANAGISDLEPIANIVRIQRLVLAQCSISDITPLAGLLNLKLLDLSTNQVRDISPIKTQQFIESLFLNDNEIADLTPIANYTRLTRAHVEQNFLDITPGADDRTVIDTWIGWGATVIFEPQKEVPFEGPRFLARLSGENVQLEWLELVEEPNRLQESVDLDNWVDSEVTIEMGEGRVRTASLLLGDVSAKFFRLIPAESVESKRVIP